MATKIAAIPVLKPTAAEMERHHFGDTEWKPIYSGISSFFHINRIEDYRKYLRLPLPPHRKTVYDFIFLTQGNSLRSKGLDEYMMTQNSFFFLPPFQITNHKSMSDDARGFYCHFDAEILLKYYKHDQLLAEFPFLQFIGHPIIQLEQSAVESVVHILNRLKNEYDLKRDRFDIISVYMMALLVEVKQYYGNVIKTGENAAFRVTKQYKEALMQYVYEKQKIMQYADMLAVTPNHLNKCVKAVTGKSAHDLLDEMILLEAKALLRQTNFPISDIAFKVGKEFLSDFVRFFKGKTGLTPTEYRQMD
ncbi:MAG TPA: helix-turn-helix domain-containing protein [Flavisolibacter sp.]|nr:helix-turn-helix domain-containing protein [Flavisolibacter sp.]